MPAARERARQDTWGRLLAPTRPARTPAPALRRSHFPDPPPMTLRQNSQSILLVVPGALHQRRLAAAVKRSLLDDGEDRCTLSARGMAPLDAMKERSLPLPGGCWKLRSIRLHQVIGRPQWRQRMTAVRSSAWTCTVGAACW